MTIQQILTNARRRLEGYTSTPDLDAALLLAYLLKKDRAWLIGHAASMVPAGRRRPYARLVGQRRRGRPLAYLTGSKEFYGRPFKVTPAVLVPRPESELLVETARQELAGVDRPRLLELGTGSGCLAVTLALELPTATVVATDISPAALVVARANARHHGVANRVTCRRQDLLAGETGLYDLIVANLPYVPDYWLTTANRTRYGLIAEPLVALAGGSSGLAIIRRLFTELSAHPVATRLLLEHGDGQLTKLRRLAASLLPGWTLTSHRDLANKPRAVILCS